jgi:hypothetical protein
MSANTPIDPAANAALEHWTARFSKPIIFIILTAIAIGVYLAFTIPVAVFPATDFPRIVVGIDNGVAPINQMQVMVTRPIEEAMNSVPGLDQVRSITSRGSAEVNLFFNWNVNMFQTLQFVNAALARVQSDLGHNAANAALGACELHDQAQTEPREWSFHGRAAGWRRPRVSNRARSREIAPGASYSTGHSRRHHEDQHD